jgi:hypothetical protein
LPSLLAGLSAKPAFLQPMYHGRGAAVKKTAIFSAVYGPYFA